MLKMSSVVALQPDVSETESKLVQDFWLKLKLMEEEKEEVKKLQCHGAAEDEQEPQNRDGDEEFEFDLENDDDEEEEEEEEDEDDFSFSRAFGDDSLIPAGEAFLDGQICPVFPLFGRDLVLPDVQPEGPYCEWRRKAAAAAVVDASPEVCKKSNSTGFSKLRRFRELVLRSNSDGKDKFAFLHHHHSHSNPEAASSKGQKEETMPAKKTSPATSTSLTAKKKKKVETSAFEKVYARRKKEEGSSKRASYLTYKQVGFFASVNGLSKNVHPY